MNIKQTHTQRQSRDNPDALSADPILGNGELGHEGRLHLPPMAQLPLVLLSLPTLSSTYTFVCLYETVRHFLFLNLTATY